MQNRNDKIIIVGGGIVGITASILLAKSDREVIVVESSSNCGGLLRSTIDDKGFHYDFGTHIPILTGIDELDDLIFGCPDERLRYWHKLHKITPICRHGSRWNEGGSLLDARILNEADYKKGLSEILSLTDNVSRNSDLESYLFKTLGSTFTKKLIDPVLEKLFFCRSRELVPDSAIFYFGLNRVTILDREKTNQLMKDPVYASKLAFHSLDDYYAWDHNRQIDAYLYPRNGKGCGYWVDYLVKKAEELGVIFLTNTKVETIRLKNEKIASLDLSNGDTLITPSALLWSASPALARRCLGHKISKPSTKFLTTNLYNISFDEDLLLDENEYIWNWEPNHKTYRVTLYPNIDKDSLKPRVTAEVLTHPDSEESPSVKNIHKELIELGICSLGSKIDYSNQIILKNTFPIPNEEFLKESSEHLNAVNNITNFSLIGRYGGEKWLLHDVLKDTYQKVTAIIN